MRFDSEVVSNVNESHMETFTKLSDNISKAENYSIVEGAQNDLQLNIFKSRIPSENSKLLTTVKRRITLKDLIAFLESNRKIPLQNLILHKAVLKLNNNN